MKKIKLLILVIIISACSSEDRKLKNQFNIHFSDTLELDFTNQLPFDLGFSSYFNFNDTLVYYISTQNESVGIEAFHLAKNQWLETKYFPLEGPNQWYNIHGGLQLIDSITAFHPLSKLFGFQLVNVLDSTTHDIFFEEEINVSGNHDNPQEVYFQSGDSIIGFPIVPYIWTDKPDYASKTSIYGLYSIPEKSWVTKIPMADEFHGQIYSSNWMDRNFMVKGDTIFVNYAKSHTIYGYNTKGELIIEKLLNYEGIQTGHQARSEDLMLNMILFEKGGHYTQFFYSKKHKLYFRFFRYLSTPPESNSMAALEEVMTSYQTGIIIADENFEIQAIETFPLREYSMTPSMHFFKDGELYIWLMNEIEDKEYYVSIVPKAETHTE